MNRVLIFLAGGGVGLLLRPWLKDITRGVMKGAVNVGRSMEAMLEEVREDMDDLKAEAAQSQQEEQVATKN